MIRKQFAIEVKESDENGGRITINTAATDRDRDHVWPAGMRPENYMKNPIVQWAHNYRDPWATVGRTKSLEVSPSGIVADFELRPAANEQDPQNIVRLLWAGGWIRAASIGFQPLEGVVENEQGGRDFPVWEILEWSLVPVPANQEALRLAVKAFDHETDPDPDPVEQVKQPAPADPDPEPVTKADGGDIVDDGEPEQEPEVAAVEVLDAPPDETEGIVDQVAEFIADLKTIIL